MVGKSLEKSLCCGETAAGEVQEGWKGSPGHALRKISCPGGLHKPRTHLQCLRGGQTLGTALPRDILRGK